ncbi:MAG: hypothetical protein ACLPYW_10920 [Acidimicrobiales bacterium]
MTHIGEPAGGGTRSKRLRVSTWVAIGIFLAALTTYILVRPAYVVVYVGPRGEIVSPPTTVAPKVTTTTSPVRKTTTTLKSTSTTTTTVSSTSTTTTTKGAGTTTTSSSGSTTTTQTSVATSTT